MFTRIVVPLDGTRFAEAALAPARELAHAFHSQILVVRAVPPPLPRTERSWDKQQEEVERLDEADAYLHGIVDELRAQGYQADLLLHIAHPGASIAQAGALGQADVIVMAAHQRWKAGLPGKAGTALRVLARTRVPILVWRAAATWEQESRLDARQHASLLARPECPILVPLDGSPFAERALEVAETLARTFDLSLVLTRAVALGTRPEQEREEERVATDYLQHVRREVERRGVRRAVIAPRHGTPLGVIDRVCRDFDAGLIVLASHGRTDPAGTFLGSTAAHLIEEVGAPVLVIRPELAEEQFLREHLTPAPISHGTV